MTEETMIFLFCAFFAILLVIICIFAIKFKLGKRKMPKLTQNQFGEKHSQNIKNVQAEKLLNQTDDEILSQPNKNENKG